MIPDPPPFLVARSALTRAAICDRSLSAQTHDRRSTLRQGNASDRDDASVSAFVPLVSERLHAMKRSVTVTVNGTPHADEVEPRLLLVHYLRDVLGLTGTHVGCETSICGACTVMLDGRAVKSCTLLAVQADGAQVTTIEGLARDGKLHPVQDGFWERHGLQCGYCTPGMIVAAAQLIERT